MKKTLKKAGFVVLVGRPNVGKSTFLNNLLGEKVSIVSKVPQTTRFSIRCILNDKRGQVVFIDTPGILLSKKRLTKFLSNRTFSVKDEADIVLYMVDLSRMPGSEEKEVLEHLKDMDQPIIMVLNKRDLGQTFADEYIEFWKQNIEGKNDPLKYFIPISALEKRGLDEVLDAVFEFLPESPPLYPLNVASDLPEKIMISDIIREKVFWLAYQELPHSVAVRVDEITHKKNKLMYIQAVILVERNSQKAIIIGKKGGLLKKIGTAAREELEKSYKKRVFVDLRVKVQSNWQKDMQTLRELGYIV
ncbi:MAG: GTPase Era [Candidatus Omnitrophica bacterium]|nr:GTPase Era [Candidatus Omnitrophota bacterium]